jgi:hypothetical protein
VDLLVEQASQADRIDSEARGLGAVIRVEMEGTVSVSVRMTIQARNAEAGLGAFAVFRLIELLLWEGVSNRRSPSICTGVRIPCISW